MSSEANSNGNYSSGSGYLSSTKLVLLICIEQYSRHYDWGPATLSELGEFLALHLYEATAWTVASLDELCNSLDKISVKAENQTLLPIVRQRLCALETIDDLYMFFDAVGQLVVDAEARMESDEEVTLLDSESIFGIFIRRCCLAFNLMDFQEISRFFAECLDMVRTIAKSDGERKPVVYSQLEMQEQAEVLISRLEEESQTPLPEKMEKDIRRSLEQLPRYSRIHYLQYLDLVRRGESEQSEISLRRFFDSNTIKDNRTIYQYALMYMAAMRAQLGMIELSQEALREATQVARDCQDHICLLYIICWEARLMCAALQHDKHVSKNRLKQLLIALVAKASSMRNHEMEIAGRILQTDLLILTKGPKEEVFESLVLIQALIVEHDVRKMREQWHRTASRAWAEYEKQPWARDVMQRLLDQTSSAETPLH
ncbi:hypothetical protein GGI15_004134 [Coemansia interrupta]|uniref:Anaphase-promoting complex subunit 5 n=1 Tax=Coemansia interrupta TaxID=1126814 RepID=A0A9W8HC05_9FUNG|nr:hypothetical protein GGI15_004134 [Coemansia interrupta]